MAFVALSTLPKYLTYARLVAGVVALLVKPYYYCKQVLPFFFYLREHSCRLQWEHCEGQWGQTLEIIVCLASKIKKEVEKRGTRYKSFIPN